MLTGLAQAAACVALAFAGGIAEIIALVTVLAAGLALTQPCLQALLADMVAPGDLPRATALSQTATAAGTMLAPALAGLLMGHFGVRVPLLADAASYLAIAAAGGLIRTRRGGRAPAPPVVAGTAPGRRLAAAPGPAGLVGSGAHRRRGGRGQPGQRGRGVLHPRHAAFHGHRLRAAGQRLDQRHHGRGLAARPPPAG